MWKDYIWNTDNDGVMWKTWLHYDQSLWLRITVRNGQTVRVDDWNVGVKRVD